MATQQLLIKLNIKSTNLWQVKAFHLPHTFFLKLSVPSYFLCAAMWCQVTQMESSISGTGRPPSSTTGSKLTTRCALALCGTLMKPPKSSRAVGTGRSNSGIRSINGGSVNSGLKVIDLNTLVKATGLVSSLIVAVYFYYVTSAYFSSSKSCL